jgi:hypothetical protein
MKWRYNLFINCYRRISRRVEHSKSYVLYGYTSDEALYHVAVIMYVSRQWRHEANDGHPASTVVARKQRAAKRKARE